MNLRGIEFGHVFNASGARNFFGDGYWFHDVLRPFGLDFTGSTFVAKTTTIDARAGNMPLLTDGITPVERVPRCIIVKPFRGVTLNAVGLSGPGLEKLLVKGEWFIRKDPFVISFMAVGSTREERLKEMRRFAKIMEAFHTVFRVPVAVEINLSCPNTGHAQDDLVDEASDVLDCLKWLGAPVILKINALLDPARAVLISRHTECDAIDVSNTIPWGALNGNIPWKRLFGTDESPLAQFGGGGLGGTPLLPIVSQWIMFARAMGLKKPIIGGGGILSKNDADVLLHAGANAVSLGSVALLRPWRVRGIIKHVNKTLNGGSR